MSIRIGVVLVMLALTACKGGGQPPPDDLPDSGTPDSGTPDSGTPDSGTPDSGTPDSGTPDSGTPTPTGCFQVPEDATMFGEHGFQTGTAKSEEFLDVAINARGTLYLAGYENGDVGAARFDPSGDSRGVVVRVGKSPEDVEVQYWDKFIDIPGSTETIDSLAFHPVTGALYFAGRTTGAFNQTNGASANFTHQGQQDLFVAGPNGNTRDVVLYQGGTTRPQHPTRLGFDAQGNLIVSGFDDFYVPSGTNYVERWEDPFIVKLKRSADERTLVEEWYKTFETSYTDTLAGMVVDTAGDSSIYVTGNSASGTQRGPFVRKLDNATGTLAAPLRQSTISMDTVHGAHINADGTMIIAGSTFGLLGKQAYGEQDVFIRKLDKETNYFHWTQQYGSEGSDFVTDMAVDKDGNIIVVGETLGTVVEPPFVNRGSYDVFMMKFDKDGNRLEAQQWGSEGDDHPNAVAVDACGQIFIVGYTSGQMLPPYSYQGERDAFVITTARPASSGDGEVSTQLKR